MAQYLDKFKGIIGKKQTEQILKLLNKKRNQGQIRTVKEFSEQLQGLVRELTSTVLTPSLKLWLGVQDEVIDSETYNFMLDRVQDDLEASFEEANKIDEVQKSHEAIVRDVILKNLRAGVAELESKISLYEFLNKDLRGFDSAVFSTFRESKEARTQRGDAQASVIFLDPRTNLLIPNTEDATVELVGERLTLPNDLVEQHSIRNIRQIFDSETPQSELIVEPANVSLSNIIDNTKGTYWFQSLLFSSPKNYVKVKLEFDLGAVKEINYVEVEPASRYGFILEAIHYVDGNNVVTDLEVPEIAVESPINVRIKKVATRRLILTFRNENPSKVQFEYGEGSDPLFDQALIEPPEGIEPTIGGVSQDLKEILGSVKMQDIIGLQDVSKTSFSGYEFLTGFDNIRIGLTTYRSRGVYISSPLELENMGEIGLKTIESRPYLDSLDQQIRFTNTTYDIAQDSGLEEDAETTPGYTSPTYFQGSIEYWIVKQDISAEDILLRTTVFPILPLGVSKIHHERLLLTEKSDPSLVNNDLGETIFYTVPENVTVYRNGEILENVSSDPLALEGWKHYPEPSGDTADKLPNNNQPMRFRIQIVAPLAGDIFTVTYTPLISTTTSIPKNLSEEYTTVEGLKVVDLVGDLTARVGPGQVVIVGGLGEELEIAKSKIVLKIILRQNTAESSLTPAVEEYTLVSGYKDETKFKGD